MLFALTLALLLVYFAMVHTANNNHNSSIHGSTLEWIGTFHTVNCIVFGRNVYFRNACFIFQHKDIEWKKPSSSCPKIDMLVLCQYSKFELSLELGRNVMGAHYNSIIKQTLLYFTFTEMSISGMPVSFSNIRILSGKNPHHHAQKLICSCYVSIQNLNCLWNLDEMSWVHTTTL